MDLKITRKKQLSFLLMLACMVCISGIFQVQAKQNGIALKDLNDKKVQVVKKTGTYEVVCNEKTFECPNPVYIFKAPESGTYKFYVKNLRSQGMTPKKSPGISLTFRAYFGQGVESDGTFFLPDYTEHDYFILESKNYKVTSKSADVKSSFTIQLDKGECVWIEHSNLQYQEPDSVKTKDTLYDVVIKKL